MMESQPRTEQGLQPFGYPRSATPPPPTPAHVLLVASPILRHHGLARLGGDSTGACVCALLLVGYKRGSASGDRAWWLLKNRDPEVPLLGVPQGERRVFTQTLCECPWQPDSQVPHAGNGQLSCSCRTEEETEASGSHQGVRGVGLRYTVTVTRARP